MIFKTIYAPVLFVLFIVVILSIVLVISFINKDSSAEVTEKYQGPVQEGYDEQLFRDTGVYQKIEEEEHGN